MAVLETDMTAFLMSQTKTMTLILHIVPGPSVSDREMRTFVFNAMGVITFTIDDLVLLPKANKAIFYS